MRRFFSAIAAICFGVTSFPSGAMGLAQACSDINKKFVVHITKPFEKDDVKNSHLRVNICPLERFIESGEDCEYGIWSKFNTLGRIVDLNGDKHFDLILSFFPGGLWTGEQAFLVLVGCGDDTYVEVLGEEGGESFADLWVKDVPKNNEWVDLHAIRLYHRPGLTSFGGASEDFNIENLILKFNPNTFQYHVISKSQIREMTEDDDTPRPSISPSFEPNILWEKFPSRPFPSFDCAQARISVEKAICADKNLSRLDFILVRNYKALWSADIGKVRDKLLHDQREWIKRRNKCNISNECISNVYKERITEVCNNYPVVTGPKPFCVQQE